MNHTFAHKSWRKEKRPAFCTVLIGLILFASVLSQVFLNQQVSAAGNAPAYAADRSKSATDIPSAPPPGDRVVITLVTEELLGQLADGVTYTFWTFNGTVPGPMIRLREGQTVEMHIKNAANSTMLHSIDSHAIYGTGGGSAFSQTPPGQESIFQFKALRAGLYIYHCATPDIPTHIANGMYGLMLVEPPSGLTKVDREFYVVQGEFYTQGPLGQQGYQAFSYAKANAETPEYVVFNGGAAALTGSGAMKANVGETIRIFFGNGGPNLISSFHAIGGIWDRVYSEGAIVSEPVQNVQTTLVPAGGSAMVEFKAEVAGKYTLVDHSLFRIHRGAVGMIVVDGPPNPEIYSSMKNATTQGPQTDGHTMNTTTMTETSTTAGGSANPSNIVEVAMENYAYEPAELTITVGTEVTWINKDPVDHTVTEGTPEVIKPPNERAFDSSNGAQYQLIKPGESWSFTFTTPGTYDYYCIPHPYMKARITVLPAGSSGQQSTNPYTDFTVVLTGQQIFTISAFGLVALVGLMAVFAKSGRRPTESQP